jgi:hypothetical protein
VPDARPSQADAPRVTTQPCTTYPAWTLCQGPSCLGGRCQGVDVPQDLSCHGEACCLAGEAAGGTIEIARHLKRALTRPPDQSTDDAIAVNEALECAASRRGGAVVVFAPGRYLLRTPIRPRSDDLWLIGPTGPRGRATLVADPCNPEQHPGAVQVSDRWIKNLLIRGFRIELQNGPRLPPGDRRATSNSGIQINRCANCTVEQVDMQYTGGEPAECKPYNLDGITFAVGSWGAIRDVRVRGMPKAGLYAASVTPAGPLLIERSEVLECNGPLGATGISVVAPDVTIRDCLSHHNQRHPFPVPAAPPEEGGGLLVSSQSAREAVPARVRVEGSSFDDNGGCGVVVGGAGPEARPQRISMVDVFARRNGANGIRIEAGDDILLSRVEVAGNGGQGVMVTGEANPQPEAPRLGTVTIRDPIVHDNGAQPRFWSDPAHPTVVPGIGIVLASDVEIIGGRWYRTQGAPGTQYAGVGVYPLGAPDCAHRRCVRLVGSAADQAGLSGMPTGGQVSFWVPRP